MPNSLNNRLFTELKPSFMDYRVFYSELGKLLYAVADADGVVSKEEKKSLYDLVKTRLAHKEVHTDEFGTNDVWYSVFEFDIAEDQSLTAMDAFQSFAEYLEANKHGIDLETRQLCLLLADRLAESYRHSNRKEREMVQRIRELLFSIERQPVIVQLDSKADLRDQNLIF